MQKQGSKHRSITSILKKIFGKHFSVFNIFTYTADNIIKPFSLHWVGQIHRIFCLFFEFVFCFFLLFACMLDIIILSLLCFVSISCFYIYFKYSISFFFFCIYCSLIYYKIYICILFFSFNLLISCSFTLMYLLY